VNGIVFQNPMALEAIVVCIGIALLMVDAFLSKVRKEAIAFAAIIGLLTVFGLTFVVAIEPTQGANYAVDGIAIFFKQFALLTTVLVLVMGIEYIPVLQTGVPGVRPGAGVGEFFAIPVLTCAGLMWMASARDFITIFVSLELVTISFYVLVCYMRRNRACLEAGTKFLVLGALSTGFLVYGITWIFGITGHFSLDSVAAAIRVLPESAHTSLLFGFALVLVALGFKVAAFPFQFWVPDVYQGAPTPVTAFLSVGSKAAGFVVLIRVIEPFLFNPQIADKVLTALAVLAGFTVVYGNLAALPQTNFKRLLAYSSIAHAGYLLIGVASVSGFSSGPAVAYYLAAYLVTTCLAFLVVVVVARCVGGDDIIHFNGLAARAPYLSAALLLAMLSLAGIPFTAGFIGKFLIFEAAIAAGQIALVILGAFTVACGFYYYLKIVRAMYWQPAPEKAAPVVTSRLTTAVAALLAIAIFVLGIFPQPIFQRLGL